MVSNGKCTPFRSVRMTAPSGKSAGVRNVCGKWSKFENVVAEPGRIIMSKIAGMRTFSAIVTLSQSAGSFRVASVSTMVRIWT